MTLNLGKQRGVGVDRKRAGGLYIGMVMVVVIAVIVVVAGCGGEDLEGHGDEDQATVVRNVSWRVVETRPANALRIVSHVPYCVGEFEPAIVGVDVDEFDHAIVITVEAEVSGIREQERTAACLGAGKPLYRDIKLPGPLEGRAILDGSLNPPKRRSLRGGA